LLRSAVVSALPSAPPAKFAIQVTANLEGDKPMSLFLGKDKVGTAVAELKNAAQCTITTRSYLQCEGKTMGAAPNRVISPKGGIPDIAPLEVVGNPSTIIDNYSVDGSNVLHWKSEKFADLPGGKQIMKSKSEGGQDGEAVFALAKTTEGTIKVVQLIGYAGGERGGIVKVAPGTAKAVPL
jgi:hypothetical protein